MRVRAKGIIRLNKQKLARAQDFCHFIINSRLFLCPANFFALFFNMLLTFSNLLACLGNKNILVSLGRVQDCFLSFRLGFVVPRETFCPSGLSRYAQWTPLRTKSVPRDNKAQPSGQQNNLVPSLRTPKCFCSLEMTKKLEKCLQHIKKVQKKMAGHKKAWIWQ